MAILTAVNTGITRLEAALTILKRYKAILPALESWLSDNLQMSLDQFDAITEGKIFATMPDDVIVDDEELRAVFVNTGIKVYSDMLVGFPQLDELIEVVREMFAFLAD